MLDGRLPRIAVLLLLLAPSAMAATPASNLDAAVSAGGQEITDLSIDATGQFAAGVVAFDAAKSATGGLPLGGVPTTTTRKDVYPCDFGPVERPRSGSGCRGLNHNGAVTGAPNAAQSVAMTSYTVSGGRTAKYAIAGPGAWVSRWSVTADQADWEKQLEATNMQVVNVTITANGARVIDAIAPPTGAAGSRVEFREGSNGTVMWFVDLTDAAGNAVRPTSLAVSRTGSVLAIGTTNGVLLVNPDLAGAPSGTLGGIPQAGNVQTVAVSADGNLVVAAGSNGVFLATIRRDGAKVSVESASVFNRGFGEPAQDVAFALDGSRFAVAAGSKIHFFRRLDTASIAEPVGDAFDAGARVADLAYDARGQLLVAVAGSNVYGFGPAKNAPVWTFDATTTGFGGVDGPLRRVGLSDDGMRIIVAGRTEIMAYSSVVAATATLAASAPGVTTVAPASTLPLTLTVRNAGSVPDNYTFVVVPPLGWPAASAEGLQLDPDATGTARFNVSAPAGQAPGTYAVEVRVRSAAQAALAGRNDVYVAGPAFNLTVPRSVILTVEAPDERLRLRQGEEQTIPLTLRNQGNAEGLVNLSALQNLTRGASWDVRFQPEQVRVPAGGSASASMILTAPSDAGSGDRNIVTIRALEGEIVSTDRVTAYVDPQFGAELRASNTSLEFAGGQTRSVSITVMNTGNTEDTFNLTMALTPPGVANDWGVTNDTAQVTIARGQSKTVTLTVKARVASPREAQITVKAISQVSPEGRESAPLLLNLIPKPTTTTPEDKNGIPAPAPALAALAVALLALARRRRGGA